MAPVDVYIDNRKVITLGPETETSTVATGIQVFWGGDEYRGFGVTEDGKAVGSGQLPTDLEVPMAIRKRFVAPIEKGEPTTEVSNTLKLKFRK